MCVCMRVRMCVFWGACARFERACVWRCMFVGAQVYVCGCGSRSGCRCHRKCGHSTRVRMYTRLWKQLMARLASLRAQAVKMLRHMTSRDGTIINEVVAHRPGTTTLFIFAPSTIHKVVVHRPWEIRVLPCLECFRPVPGSDSKRWRLRARARMECMICLATLLCKVFIRGNRRHMGARAWHLTQLISAQLGWVNHLCTQVLNASGEVMI